MKKDYCECEVDVIWWWELWWWDGDLWFWHSSNSVPFSCDYSVIATYGPHLLLLLVGIVYLQSPVKGDQGVLSSMIMNNRKLKEHFRCPQRLQLLSIALAWVSAALHHSLPLPASPHHHPLTSHLSPISPSILLLIILRSNHHHQPPAPATSHQHRIMCNITVLHQVHDDHQYYHFTLSQEEEEEHKHEDFHHVMEAASSLHA